MSDRTARLGASGPPTIPFVDLQAQRRRLGDRVEQAVRRVCEHGAFIMGREVAMFERQLAEFCGVRHVLSCANGTDALVIGLAAKNVGPGDAVLCPSFTFAASAEAIARVQAAPVFVDVLEDTFNVDARGIEHGLRAARAARLRPVGILAVDLFGQPADYEAVRQVAAANGLWIMADAAQSFGARYGNRRVGQITEIATTSFYPSKPLGCYGDGGALLTDDEATAAVVDSLRVHGQGAHKYENVRIGYNSRLDTIQAAILVEKLAILPEEIERRQVVADRYTRALRDVVETPRVIPQATSVWAQYTIRVKGGRRDTIASLLNAAGVPTAIHYPVPLHRQEAYRHFPRAEGGLAVSESLAKEVLSLPIHAYLDEPTQEYIIAETRKAVAAVRR
ncbi:MAG: DegT/DnrJ/EryC1/StrS family aminotransferase [Alphaproteobacteria bacterium]|nr:DegT/DnrJ/EryC1/StrS family aminotransferase [Alphaproteobacteria bacterium]